MEQRRAEKFLYIGSKWFPSRASGLDSEVASCRTNPRLPTPSASYARSLAEVRAAANAAMAEIALW